MNGYPTESKAMMVQTAKEIGQLRPYGIKIHMLNILNHTALGLAHQVKPFLLMDQEEYENCYFLNASSNQKPGIIDADKNEIMDQSEFYSGCYGRASLNFFAFNQAGNRGIGVGLNNVQKLADGEPLAGRNRAEDDFDDDIEDDDDLLG